MDQPGSQEPATSFRLLTETAPGSLMGRLLRRFWQPVALANSVAKGKARPLRILGEDLTLYRGESGRPHLIAGRCAHRCTTLHTGWVRGEEIQCMYHGWRYDGTGLCTDIPAENRARSTPVKIAGYPVHEYGDVLFAYLGEGPVPGFDLPRKDVLEQSDRAVFTQLQIWDCNWFQQVENSLDAVHVSFVHVWGKVGAFRRSGHRRYSEVVIRGDQRRHSSNRHAIGDECARQRLDVSQQQPHHRPWGREG